MNHTELNRSPLAVIAVGGNSLIRTPTTPKSATSGTPCETASNIANLIRRLARSSPTATGLRSATSYAATKLAMGGVTPRPST